MYMSVICCYILYVCEMLCVCYVSSSSGLLYLYMSVLCCYMLYVSYMLYVCYTSSLGGVVRIRLYIIYAHLCNHHTSYKVVVGLGAQLCTQLEVWVLGVGMSTLGTQTVCTPRIGGSKYRWPWSMYSIEWGTSSYTVQ
jgi:hypothetical protein